MQRAGALILTMIGALARIAIARVLTPSTTVAVLRCVAALPLSVMSWLADGVTFRHLVSDLAI